MLLFELFEALEPGDAQALQAALNRLVYMPDSAMRAGKPVIKLDLSQTHFVSRAEGDKEGRFDQDPTDWTLKELQNLLVRAFTDPKLGFSNDIKKWCGGDFESVPEGGRGHQIFDPVTKLRLGFVINENPKMVELKTPYAGFTRERKPEPRNIMRAMTIFRPQRPHYSTPHDNPVAAKLAKDHLPQKKTYVDYTAPNSAPANSFIKPVNRGPKDRFSSRRKPPVRGGQHTE